MIVMIVADPADPDIIWMNTYQDSSITNFNKDLLGKTIIRFNTKTKAFQQFFPDDKTPFALPANGVFILKDSLKRTWFSTIKGVSLYNAAKNIFTNYVVPTPGDCICPVTICSDKDGNLWVGSSAGLYYLNIKTGKYDKIENNTYEGSLPVLNFGIDNLFYDKSGTFWVNMPWSGIAYLDKQKTQFEALPIRQNGSSITEKNIANPFF